MFKRILVPVDLTEPEFAGSNPVWMGTTAVKDSGSWVIRGHKWFNKDVIADHAVRPCRRGRRADRRQKQKGYQLLQFHLRRRRPMARSDGSHCPRGNLSAASLDHCANV